jgi:cell division protein FtsW
VIGVEVNGNRNWISLAGMTLQPSELAKLAVALWGADLLARKTRLLDQPRHLLVPLLPVSALVVGLVLVGRDLGTSVVLIVIVAALLFFAGAPLRVFTVASGFAAAGVLFLVVTSPNRMRRITSFLDPSADTSTTGYQLLHSKFALGGGGWFGVGLGASREKWPKALPQEHTDFIFAIIGEELGLVGTLTVLVLFATLGYAGIRIASRTRDPFVRLAASAITAWLVMQATINIGAVLGVLPIAGVPLPLLSYGGSALLTTLLALGVLLALARSERGAAAALNARRRRSAARARGALRHPRQALRRS